MAPAPVQSIARRKKLSVKPITPSRVGGKGNRQSRLQGILGSEKGPLIRVTNCQGIESRPRLLTLRFLPNLPQAVPRPGPIHMLNLVRLRDVAVYPDGRNVSGAEAYAAYCRESGPLFLRLGALIV